MKNIFDFDKKNFFVQLFLRFSVFGHFLKMVNEKYQKWPKNRGRFWSKKYCYDNGGKNWILYLKYTLLSSKYFFRYFFGHFFEKCPFFKNVPKNFEILKSVKKSVFAGECSHFRFFLFFFVIEKFFLLDSILSFEFWTFIFVHFWKSVELSNQIFFSLSRL